MFAPDCHWNRRAFQRSASVRHPRRRVCVRCECPIYLMIRIRIIHPTPMLPLGASFFFQSRWWMLRSRHFSFLNNFLKGNPQSVRHQTIGRILLSIRPSMDMLIREWKGTGSMRGESADGKLRAHIKLPCPNLRLQPRSVRRRRGSSIKVRVSACGAGRVVCRWAESRHRWTHGTESRTDAMIWTSGSGQWLASNVASGRFAFAHIIL
jgi:hypothetical protein